MSAWLSLVYVLARPLAAARVSPHAVTVAGPLLASAAVWCAAAGGRWLLLGAGAVAASGVADGVDGAVALLRARASGFGSVLDSIADRLGEAAYGLALWLAGAPGLLAGGAALTGYLQEYGRARATAVGMPEIGVVTVAERPTRVLVTVLTLVAVGLVPTRAGPLSTAGAGVWVALGIVGLVQLLVAVRRRLRDV